MGILKKKLKKNTIKERKREKETIFLWVSCDWGRTGIHWYLLFQENLVADDDIRCWQGTGDSEAFPDMERDSFSFGRKSNILESMNKQVTTGNAVCT